jgi:predicted nucleic acid-binding protein
MRATKLSTEENIERVKLLKECYNEYNTTMKKKKTHVYFWVANLEKVKYTSKIQVRLMVRIIIVQTTLQILSHQ